MEVWLVLGIFAVVVWVGVSQFKKRKRRRFLVSKYGSEEIADAIMAQKVWQGMTSEQLVDSWGRPEDIDETVYKTKRKEVWKRIDTAKE